MASSDPLFEIFVQALRARRFAIGESLTFEDVAGSTRRAVRALAAAGVGPGEVVVYQGPQNAEAFVAFWATVALGAVFAPLDRQWPEYLVQRAAGALEPRVVISDAERAAFHRSLFPQAQHVSLAAPSASSPEAWERWLAEAAKSDAASDAPAQMAGNAPAAYLFTSGSTGVPKAVVLSRSALARGGRVTVEHLGWKAGETLVNTPEPHTMSGLRNSFVAAPLAGMRLHIVAAGARTYAFALLEALRTAPCHRLVTSPILIRHLLMLGDRVRRDAFAGVKAVYCTGARLGGSDVAAFYARFGARLVNYYGLTETGGICVAQRLAGWRPDDGSLGFAAGAELRVVDEAGRPARAGTGELRVRSPQLMSGYLGDPDATAARIVRGWLRTGDLARIEPDGRCFLLGRIDGFLKSASTDRIAPEEVEGVLEEHPSVAEAAVLGVPSEHEGEQIVALVVPRAGEPPVTALELAAFVCDRLGPARTPAHIQFTEALPRQTGGKLRRAELPGLLSTA